MATKGPFIGTKFSNLIGSKRVITTGVFPTAPRDGEWWIDSTNNRLYVFDDPSPSATNPISGAWYYATLLTTTTTSTSTTTTTTSTTTTTTSTTTSSSTSTTSSTSTSTTTTL